MIGTLSYAYKPKPGVVFLAPLFFFACAAFMAYLAATNDEALIIDNFIELSPSGASTLYVLLALASGVLVLAGLNGVRLSLMKDRAVLLTAQAITVPGWLPGSQPPPIPYANITALTLQRVKRTRIVVIRHDQTLTRVSERFFESPALFEDFLVHLQGIVQPLLQSRRQSLADNAVTISAQPARPSGYDTAL